MNHRTCGEDSFFLTSLLSTGRATLPSARTMRQTVAEVASPSAGPLGIRFLIPSLQHLLPFGLCKGVVGLAYRDCTLMELVVS